MNKPFCENLNCGVNGEYCKQCKDVIEKIEYNKIKELSLINKIKIFGWLSDLLAEEDKETILLMHEDKIKRIKLLEEINDLENKLYERTENE